MRSGGLCVRAVDSQCPWVETRLEERLGRSRERKAKASATCLVCLCSRNDDGHGKIVVAVEIVMRDGDAGYDDVVMVMTM